MKCPLEFVLALRTVQFSSQDNYILAISLTIRIDNDKYFHSLIVESPKARLAV